MKVNTRFTTTIKRVEMLGNNIHAFTITVDRYNNEKLFLDLLKAYKTGNLLLMEVITDKGQEQCKR